MVDWLVDCPKAVAALLSAPGWVDATIAVLIERCVVLAGNETPQKDSTSDAHTSTFPTIRRRPLPCDDWICCLSAVLLGECLLYCGEDVQVRTSGRLPCGDFDQSAEKRINARNLAPAPQNSPRSCQKTSSCPAWDSPSTLALSGGSSRTFRSTVRLLVSVASVFLSRAVRRSCPYLHFPEPHPT